MTDKPDVIGAAFASLRSLVPSTAKAVNVYHRRTARGVETLFAFHDLHIDAQAALDSAQRGGFLRGVTFARGLDISSIPPSAFIVADAFESPEA